MTDKKQTKQTVAKKVEIEQVSSKDLQPPTEPAEPTEADIKDLAAEEAELAELQAKVKAKRATISARKKQKLGGKKLESKRTWVENTTNWALKPKHVSKTNDIERIEVRGGAAISFVESIERANQAVAALQDYEEQIKLPKAERLGDKWAETIVKANEAAEILTSAYKLVKVVPATKDD